MIVVLAISVQDGLFRLEVERFQVMGEIFPMGVVPTFSPSTSTLSLFLFESTVLARISIAFAVGKFFGRW